MRKGLFLLALVTLSLALAAPALAQTPSPAKAKAEPAKTETAKTPSVDRDKAYLLQQEFVAATAELRGKLWARQAELEILLASKPDDAPAIKALAGEILNLRGTLFERTIEFRLRLAKEAGLPIRASRHLLAPRPGGDRPMMHRRGQLPPPPPDTDMMDPGSGADNAAPAAGAKKP